MLKKVILISVVILLTSVATVSVTRRIAWDPKERPRMELSQALKLAHERLNAQEKLPVGDDKYYYIGAMLAITTSKDGDWTFTFGSKEGIQRWVVVDFDGQVVVRQEAPEY